MVSLKAFVRYSAWLLLCAGACSFAPDLPKEEEISTGDAMPGEPNDEVGGTAPTAGRSSGDAGTTSGQGGSDATDTMAGSAGMPDETDAGAAGADGGSTSTAGGADDDSVAGTTSGNAGVPSTAGSSAGGAAISECRDIDCCPDDPDKNDPGGCGCGKPDTDTDDDGTLDCEDACPEDGEKTKPGDCGCGYEDTPECVALKAALVHRYSFNGNGTMAVDSAGYADGRIVGAQLSGTGSLSLAGGDSDEYVDLPNGIISGFTSVTIEIWLTWNGGGPWQRIFDFGSSNRSEGTQGTGQSYLFLIPSTADGDLRAAYSTSGISGETRLTTATGLSSSAASHAAVVVDELNTTLALYQNGSLQASTADFQGRLSAIEDVNNWIGRSQFSADPELGAVLEEFRIYDEALSEAAIAASFEAGPDPGFLP